VLDAFSSYAAQTYSSRELVVELSIYDEISSTSYSTRKYRSRQEGKGLKGYEHERGTGFIRGYFAPDDSFAHFTSTWPCRSLVGSNAPGTIIDADT
jgi:hypothetical protein